MALGELALPHLEFYCRPAVLVDFLQNRIVLVATKTEANTKFLGQPLFGDAAAIEIAIEKQVECAIIPFHHFEHLVPNLL